MTEEFIGALYLFSFVLLIAAWMIEFSPLYWLPYRLKNRIVWFTIVIVLSLNVGCITAAMIW